MRPPAGSRAARRRRARSRPPSAPAKVAVRSPRSSSQVTRAPRAKKNASRTAPSLRQAVPDRQTRPAACSRASWRAATWA